MKRLILIVDGSADKPIKSLGDKTPFEYSNTPFFDRLKKDARTFKGRLKTIPDGIISGSDVAHFTILGYDPMKEMSGRAYYEALGNGMLIEEDDIVFRMSFIFVEKDILMEVNPICCKDIKNENFLGILEEKLNTYLEENYGIRIEIYKGFNYRYIAVIKGLDDKSDKEELLKRYSLCPNQFVGEELLIKLPLDGIGKILGDIYRISQEIIAEELDTSEKLAIWLWGAGRKGKLESFKKRYGLSGTIISAVDLLRGIGVAMGLEAPLVEGATGRVDTNYGGKVRAAISAFEDGRDFVLIHLEGADEASHEKNLYKKIQAIENFDEKILTPMIQYLEEIKEDYRVIVMSDHTTYVENGKHGYEDVDYIFYNRSGLKVIEPRLEGDELAKIFLERED